MSAYGAYKERVWIVQCKQSHSWETIAAFNHERVAQQYADQCHRSNLPMRFEYRVCMRVNHTNWRDLETKEIVSITR